VAGSYTYVVRWYDDKGNRYETQPMRNSEGAAAVARSKVSVGYRKVAIMVGETNDGGTQG
jgi:hypothetical protein